ncbi:hypothetical protein LC609_13320 [Nostoc sp. XA013]|nr:hypothetical protein [Nostoc sp. XA013]
MLGYCLKDPWLILTDLEPQQADPFWYGLRPSTECVYPSGSGVRNRPEPPRLRPPHRDIKSDGWQWHNNRLLDPKRAERLWLAIAVSTLWMVMLGGDAEINHLPQI